VLSSAVGHALRGAPQFAMQNRSAAADDRTRTAQL